MFEVSFGIAGNIRFCLEIWKLQHVLFNFYFGLRIVYMVIVNFCTLIVIALGSYYSFVAATRVHKILIGKLTIFEWL